MQKKYQVVIPQVGYHIRTSYIYIYHLKFIDNIDNVYIPHTWDIPNLYINNHVIHDIQARPPGRPGHSGIDPWEELGYTCDIYR
jgi:hypothetical protein